jgi:hypothetical protein
MPIDWEGIRTAIADVERRRAGLPSRMEMEARHAEEARAAAESASGLETAALSRERTRAEIAGMPGEQDLTRRLREAQIRNYDEQPRQPQPGGDAYLSSLDPTQLAEYVRRKKMVAEATRGPEGQSGSVRLVNTTDEAGNPIQRAVRLQEGQEFGPSPTAEMRNTEYQSGAVEPAFELVRQSLQSFKQAAAGGLPGAPSAIIPGTDAYFAKSRFQDQAKALLGAIVARQAGEGSRLSDEDRVAYSQAASLVNGALMLPGGIEEAEARVGEAQRLIEDVMARRKAVGAGHPLTGAAPSRPAGVPPDAQWDPATRRWRR